jgi:molybdopterin/thiamine biosynthesis adenylyltransferase
MVNAGGNDRCEELGVYGMVTGMVGTGMSSEVIKLLVGNEGISIVALFEIMLMFGRSGTFTPFTSSRGEPTDTDNTYTATFGEM